MIDHNYTSQCNIITKKNLAADTSINHIVEQTKCDSQITINLSVDIAIKKNLSMDMVFLILNH